MFYYKTEKFLDLLVDWLIDWLCSMRSIEEQEESDEEIRDLKVLKNRR